MSDPSKYPIEVFYSADDEGYVALARDLPGCSAFGATQPEAVAELQDAIVAWQEAAHAAGNTIPEPSNVDLPSGRILLRLPRNLHGMLADGARREDVSLNQHIVSLLSASTTLNQVAQHFGAVILQQVMQQQAALPVQPWLPVNPGQYASWFIQSAGQPAGCGRYFEAIPARSVVAPGTSVSWESMFPAADDAIATTGPGNMIVAPAHLFAQRVSD